MPVVHAFFLHKLTSNIDILAPIATQEELTHALHNSIDATIIPIEGTEYKALVLCNVSGVPVSPEHMDDFCASVAAIIEHPEDIGSLPVLTIDERFVSGWDASNVPVQ